MKNKALIRLLLLVIPSFVLICQMSAIVIPQQSDSLFIIQTANVEMVVDSSHGAKIVSMKINGEEFLYNTRETMYGLDIFYGSTAWVGPESERGWPPQVTFDDNAYTVTQVDNILTFTSGIQKVGDYDLQMVKKYWIEESDTSINIRYSVVNKSAKARNTALWDLTRVPCNGLTFWTKGDSLPWSTTQLDMTDKVVDAGDLYWLEFSDDYEVEKKIFSDADEGWVAHINDSNQILIKTFEKVAFDNYKTADEQIEYWVSLEHKFLEVESQGKYVDLQPSDTLHYDMKWYLRTVPQSVDVYAGSSELVDYTRYWTKSKAQGGNMVSVAKEELTNDGLIVYPNPSSDYIVFDWNSYETATVSIYSTMGQLVLSENIVSGAPLDISSVMPGIYLYKVGTKFGQCTGRVVVR